MQTNGDKQEVCSMNLTIEEKKIEDLEHAYKVGKEMQIAQTAVDEVLENITMLDTVSGEEELNKIMPQLLASLGRYSMADRSYVFSSETDFAKYCRKCSQV